MAASTVKRQKLSQDTVSSSDEEGASKPTPDAAEGGAQRNADGEPFFELSSKRRITIRKWRASTLIDIREFYGDDSDLKPGKKGISLSLEQWKELLRLAPEIDAALSQP